MKMYRRFEMENKMVFPAHIKYLPSGQKVIQTVSDHIQNTAQYASERLCSIGLADAAFAAGYFHDFGKYTKKSMNYQEKAARGEEVIRGSVIHTFQGCRFLLERHHDTSPTFEDITIELLAYAVAAHHGLFDGYDELHKSGFLHRIKAENCDYEEAKKNFMDANISEQQIDEMLERAHLSLQPIYEIIQNLVDNSNRKHEDLHFYMGLLARLLTSAVIEGDRRDTAEFMNGPVLQSISSGRTHVWDSCLKNVENKLHEFRQETEIEKARRVISDRCRDAAEKCTGIFRLNVPTGGGKTLSSLRFALTHAKKWNKRRIIFVAPLLSIIDQNAAVLRSFIMNEDMILEHHSDIIKQENNTDTLHTYELLLENWDAPIIITTMVQLLNTMFTGKTGSIRRFSALVDSIIVIDEVQTVPDKMLSLFNLTINFLAKVCKTTIVLCSATQPPFEIASHSMVDDVTEIVPYDDKLWKVFARTRIISEETGMPLHSIPEYIAEKMKGTDSLLVICNKKTEAEFLYRNIPIQDITAFHLSASMCMAHRRDTLKALNEALHKSKAGGQKVLCIATQVIEAGVDISFGCVIRFNAGLESIIQSAGRCNRNGEAKHPAPVYVVTCSDEKLGRLREIQSAKNASNSLFYEYRRSPMRFREDLTSDEAIRFYYTKLYNNQPEGYQDYMIDKLKVSIFSLLSENRKYADERSEKYGVFFLNQAFKTAGMCFQVFDDNTETVVVPYGKGKKLIEELLDVGEKADQLFLQKWLVEVKPYTVSIYEYQRKQLQSEGIYTVAGVTLLQPSNYDDDIGMITEHKAMDYWEV